MSSKLESAMADIEKILRKYDIAGHVVLHEPGQIESKSFIEPSFSCARWYPGEAGVHFRAKKEDFGGDANARDKVLRNTAGMCAALAEGTGKASLRFFEIGKGLDDATGGRFAKPPELIKPAKFVVGDQAEFQYKAISRVTFENTGAAGKTPGSLSAKLKRADFNLELSGNIDRNTYIGKTGLPTKAGVLPLTTALAMGLVGNVVYAEQHGYWEKSKHLAFMMEHIQKGLEGSKESMPGTWDE